MQFPPLAVFTKQFCNLKISMSSYLTLVYVCTTTWPQSYTSIFHRRFLILKQFSLLHISLASCFFSKKFSNALN